MRARRCCSSFRHYRRRIHVQRFIALCTTLNQLGADAKLARLKEDFGLQGNGHFMNEELNNGEIAKSVFIPFLESIK